MLGATAGAAWIIGVSLVAYVIAELICRRLDRKSGHWRARVWWEGETYTHAAKSEQEGREWASCYPAEAAVSIEFVQYDRATFMAGRNLAF